MEDLHRPAGNPIGGGRSRVFVIGALYGSLASFIVLTFLSRRRIGSGEAVDDVSNYIRSSYVKPVDQRSLTEAALQGMVSALDPYSHFYPAGAEMNSLGRETSGHYLGLGVVFVPPSNEYRVLFTLPGSPGERAGLATGDRILTVDGESLAGAPSGRLQALMGSRPARAWLLGVENRQGRTREVEVTPADLVDPTLRHARLLGEQRNVAYVALVSFSAETPAEFDAALQALARDVPPEYRGPAGLCGLIIDLRGNLGGVLRSAVAVANRFIRSGLIVSREGRSGIVRHEADPKLAAWEGLPLVLLLDGDSASASEVLAAALQDHRAAVLVGTPTYGKGVVQTIRTFDEGAVRLTTAYYYTPARRNLERTVANAWESGILPDLSLPSSKEEHAAIRSFLQRYSPPEASLPAIQAWEAELGAPLMPRHPPDAQLDAALALLRGERPGAWSDDATH